MGNWLNWRRNTQKKNSTPNNNIGDRKFVALLLQYQFLLFESLCLWQQFLINLLWSSTFGIICSLFIISKLTSLSIAEKNPPNFSKFFFCFRFRFTFVQQHFCVKEKVKYTKQQIWITFLNFVDLSQSVHLWSATAVPYRNTKLQAKGDLMGCLFARIYSKS